MTADRAESKPGRANRMRPERVVRYGGLALVLLFPLLSLLQLRDTERPWREVARRARPSVLALYGDHPAEEMPRLLTCGLVIQVDPARVVVPGRAIDSFVSHHDGERLTWTPLYTDIQGEFTVLEAQAEPAASGRSVPSLAPAKLMVDPHGDLPQEVEVALVAPSTLPDEPLWVGILSAGSNVEGRPGYFGAFLTPISATGFAAAEAWAGSTREMDPALRGAPFVDASGNIVAVLLDRGPRGLRALPVTVLAQTLALLYLQAAK